MQYEGNNKMSMLRAILGMLRQDHHTCVKRTMTDMYYISRRLEGLCVVTASDGLAKEGMQTTSSPPVII